jgi:hypothetical protein
MALYTVYSLEEKNEWNKALSHLPLQLQDIYYSPEYYALYENAGHGKAVCFVLSEKDKIALYPFLLNRVPFIEELAYDIEGCYGYNGVVSNTNDASFQKLFFQEFEAYCEKTHIIAEFTRFNPITDNAEFSQNFMNCIHDRNTVLLDLNDSEQTIWEKQFSSKNRNMIRKAQKADLEIVRERSVEIFSAFYELYFQTMKEVNAADFYFFKKEYFLQIQETIEGAWVYQAKLDGVVIGAILVLEYGCYAHYHLSARNTAYSKLAANNLLLFEAVKQAKQNGISFFHFGGGNGGEKDSLFKFKQNFSKKTRPFHIGKKVRNQDMYDKVINLWRETNKIDIQNESNKLLRYKSF